MSLVFLNPPQDRCDHPVKGRKETRGQGDRTSYAEARLAHPAHIKKGEEGGGGSQVAPQLQTPGPRESLFLSLQ